MSSGARAGEREDQYLAVCNLIREADSLVPTSGAQEALPKYNQARDALQKLQQNFPDWNVEIIRYRLGYLTNRLANLVNPATPRGNLAPGPAARPPAMPPADWDVQLASLQEQVRQLQTDKLMLEAKLKEALGVLPPASDPRELTRLQARLGTLERENALLAATVTQMRFQLGSMSTFSPLTSAPTGTNMDLLLQAERDRLQELNQALSGTNSSPRRPRTIVRVVGEPAGK